ncbi:MAG: peptidylprolyl isomerase [Candidatus Hatepunaea meridiana]|nr:peptidylprolyl isomerase [Candidatus Hatepunaea meridiana]
MLKTTFYFLILFLLITGCAREEIWEPEVVARVGDRKLMASEITAWEASLRQANVSQEVRSAFIRNWVEKELLYRAALDGGFAKDAWVMQRLDEITRTLLVSRLLEIEYQKLTTPVPSAIHTYFQQNSHEFIWSHLHLSVDFWRSNDRKGLERLRSNLQRGRQAGIWTGNAGSLENGRITLDGPESASPEVWKVVLRLPLGQVSKVININDDYWVFKLIDRREAGEPQGLDDVRDEIVLRLMEEARKNIKEELVRELVNEYHHKGRLQWSSQPRSTVTSAESTIKETQEIIEK